MAIPKKISTVKKDFDLNSSRSCVFHHSQWEPCRDDNHSSIPFLIYRLIFMAILVSSMTFSTLCQSYLFEIFLTNWSFTLQTLYAVLSSLNIMWRMRRSLMQKVYSGYPTESKIKSYELKEAHSTWESNVTTTDTNSILATEHNKSDLTFVNINASENQPQTQQQQQNSSAVNTTVLTTDSIAPKKSDSSVIIIGNNNNQKDNNLRIHDPPSVVDKAIWILMNVSHVLPHVVAFGYWIFVYKYDPDQRACERFRSHFIVHGTTSVLAFIDALVVAIPVRISHFVFPTFILFVYTLFSFVYEVAGGPYRNGKEYIYSILNWRHKPGRTILIVIIGLMLSPLLHLITCWGVHRFRLWLVSLDMKRRNRK